MRPTVLLRRLLGSAVGMLLATGVVVLGVTAPASADPPEVRFEDRCGAVAFTWDTGTIGGDETWATTVLRGGVVIEEFDMRSRGDRVYAARDGDIFEMRREGLHPASFVHRSPDGCAGAPALTITATSECSSLLLTFTNTGDTPVTGLQVLLTGVGGRDVPPLDPGSVDLHYPLADGAAFYVRGPLAGGDWADWLSGTYQRPAGCAPDAVEARFTTVCDGVRVDLANSARGVYRVEVLDGDRPVGQSVLTPGGTGRVDVVAAPGTLLVVRDSVAGTEFGRHTVGSPVCGTSEPTPPPTSGAPVPAPDGSSPGTGAPGDGGGLPVTGAQSTLFSVAGVLLVAVGVALFLVARRRRLRFTSADGQ